MHIYIYYNVYLVLLLQLFSFFYLILKELHVCKFSNFKYIFVPVIELSTL